MNVIVASQIVSAYCKANVISVEDRLVQSRGLMFPLDICALYGVHC